MHLNSKLLFQRYTREYFKPGLRVLEIGPDQIPSTYNRVVGDPSLVWDTIDLYQSPHLTYTATSEYEFPIPDEAYDLVLSGQVIEHVRKIWVWIREVARVCKSGGVVVTINPVSWPYHEAPIDCWRIYPEGMRALYDEAGLEVVLSAWGTLEEQQYKKHLPGRSPAQQPPRLRAAYVELAKQGFPVECSYDAITIGRKK